MVRRLEARRTDGADDAGAAELARRLVLGVQVGEPFGTGLTKGLVVQRAGHCVCVYCDESVSLAVPLIGGRLMERLTVAADDSVMG